MKKSGVTILVIIGLVILFILFCVRIVGVGQVGIITRFGTVNREVQSGLSLKLPWPIEHITKMNIQNQKVQQSADAATKDLQTVDTTVALNFNLTPASVDQVYRQVGTNYEQVVIDPILQETVKSITSEYNATDLIDQRPQVETQTLSALQKTLTPKGITVDNFSIVNFAFSADFSNAIENKQVEAQNVQAAQYKLQQAQLNAQANQVQDAALTPAILEQQAISKWDGKLPTYASGSTSVFGIPIQAGQ